jgi:hypothetical protein
MAQGQRPGEHLLPNRTLGADAERAAWRRPSPLRADGRRKGVHDGQMASWRSLERGRRAESPSYPRSARAASWGIEFQPNRRIEPHDMFPPEVA